MTIPADSFCVGRRWCQYPEPAATGSCSHLVLRRGDCRLQLFRWLPHTRPWSDRYRSRYWHRRLL